MVRILTDTTDIPITLMGEMAGICWGADIKDYKKNFNRGIGCIRHNHGRVLEYPQIYMEISDYSARVIREFYTHIAGGPTRLQESTRYVDCTNFNYVVPESIFKDTAALEKYNNCMDTISKSIKELEELGIKREDSAMLLPLGMTTKIVVRCNLRMLVSMAEQRLCTRAYAEFRKLMREILSALAFYSDEWKILVENEKIFKSKCQVLGYCPEDKSCGRYPKKAYEGPDYSEYLKTLDLKTIENTGSKNFQRKEIKNVELIEE